MTTHTRFFIPHPALLITILFLILLFSANQSIALPLSEKTEPGLKIGILSLASPAKTFRQWQGFAGYLTKKLGREVEIVVPKGFNKIKKKIENDKIDIFYVNSLIYYRLAKVGKASPIAQMQNLLGKTTSNSVLFVRSDSGINDIKDLKGEKVAFISPMGAGGYLAPRAKLYSEGIVNNEKEVFTKNLTSSIHKVLLGDVKAGTMCGLNFNLMGNKLKTGELKIISTSDDYPENVIGIRKNLPNALRNKLSTIIINMDKDPEGREILNNMKGLKIQKFVKYDKESEKITRHLLATSRL